MAQISFRFFILFAIVAAAYLQQSAFADEFDWCNVTSRWCQREQCLLTSGSERRFCVTGCLLGAQIACRTG
ncbi:unnamed protein product [Orchesella dallaii]|uniref:Uncharacterized protein n=1 Tax=Orchesella dallaii TaxID=48710 RepID=A0ABP1RR25_9HEXA